MSYYSQKDPYNRYAIIRWWCQNQWWVQIVVPCVICAVVIGSLLYQWNNEQQSQNQKKIFEAQYQYWKDNPPQLDPDLEEIKTAWRVIRMKKNDPSMPIPYKKKQLIVKHWKSIIVDMRPEEIQRLHDLLQDTPVKPTDDIEIDIQKFEAPWQDDVSLNNIDSNVEKTETPTDNPSDPAKTQPANELNGVNAPDRPAPTDNLKQTPDPSAPENVTENKPSVQSPGDSPTESAIKPETIIDSQPVMESESPTGNDEANENAFKAESPTSQPEKTVGIFSTPSAAGDVEPILLDSPDAPAVENEVALNPNDAMAVNEAETLADSGVNNLGTESQKNPIEKKYSSKFPRKPAAYALEDVGPLEDNFLQQREEFIRKALEERNRKIEEFKKNQDPYYFVPSQWKRNPLIL